jgi:hypothetical protein
MGRDSVVGIATLYGLDVSGIESRWGGDFPPWCPPSFVKCVPGLFPGGKAAGVWL